MPAKRLAYPVEPHYLQLREGDFAYLRAAYPDLSTSSVIRTLVLQHVDHLRRLAAQAIPDEEIALPLQEIEDDHHTSDAAG